MNDDHKYSIYAIRCKENGKVYVGKTTNVERRVRQHLTQLKNGEKRKSVNCVWMDSDFQSDFNKYGIGSFEFYVLETDIPLDESSEREKFWINEYNSTEEAFGYNRAPLKHQEIGIEFKAGLPPKRKDT